MDQYIGVKIIKAEPMNLVNAEEFLQRKIKSGNEEGYLVEYEDGYQSWSPKDTFEAAYRQTDGMTFGLAIEAAKKGFKVARAGWNGKGMWILAQFPDANSKMSLPYLYIEYPVGHPAYPNGSRVPWLASQTDMLAEDWRIVE